MDTKRGVENLNAFLDKSNYNVIAIHGDKKQWQRQDAIRKFTSGEVPILIATDVASRGLDFPKVSYVFNFDMPKCIDDYVHRIGRTGRCGDKGIAISFINENNKSIVKGLYRILKDLKQNIPDFFQKMYDESSNYIVDNKRGYRAGSDFMNRKRDNFVNPRPPYDKFGYNTDRMGQNFSNNYKNNFDQPSYNQTASKFTSVMWDKPAQQYAPSYNSSNFTNPQFVQQPIPNSSYPPQREFSSWTQPSIQVPSFQTQTSGWNQNPMQSNQTKWDTNYHSNKDSRPTSFSTSNQRSDRSRERSRRSRSRDRSKSRERSRSYDRGHRDRKRDDDFRRKTSSWREDEYSKYDNRKKSRYDDDRR